MKIKHIIFGAVTLLVLIIIVVAFSRSNTGQSLGSSVVGNDYKSTSTSATFARTNLIKTGQGSIGSIIIASSTTEGVGIPVLSIYDGTTTIATQRASTLGTTTIAVFTASSSPGTYTFDAEFNTGLIIERSQFFSGSYTITYR